MNNTKACIQNGDLVIIYESFKSITYVYVNSSEIFQNRFGAFYHEDMIGKPFGSQLRARKSRGYITLLNPTPELWTLALNHRTQIIFTPDISAIIANLELRPGHVVIESGTGSGSLSTSFLRTIAPTGHLHTFEFNQTRADLAREEFQKNGLSSNVTVRCQDVCEELGFGLENVADAVFLDLPCPWKAIASAKKALKSQGTFCSYSPCIEQVQRTCVSLEAEGFQMIRTIETRLIPYEPRTITWKTPNFVKQRESSEKQDQEPAPEVQGTKKRKTSSNVDPSNSCVYAKKETEMRGHTAYLTFALKFNQS